MQAFVLSSFPRSGNTWVRFVLATALLGERPSSSDLDRMLPDAHKPLATPDDWIASPGVFLKSHFEPGTLAKYLAKLAPALPASHRLAGVRVLHIIRNPFDVALSVMRYFEILDRDLDRFFASFIDPNVVVPAQFAKWGFGNWSINTLNWLNAAGTSDIPIEIVRYEDLVADPVKAFAGLFDRFGVDPAAPVDECVALCAPAALRQAEEDEVAGGVAGLFSSYRADKQPQTRFIGAARAGGYLDVLTPRQIEGGLERLGPIMAKAGYDPAAFRRRSAGLRPEIGPAPAQRPR